jgi:hypothetical protein
MHTLLIHIWAAEMHDRLPPFAGVGHWRVVLQHTRYLSSYNTSLIDTNSTAHGRLWRADSCSAKEFTAPAKHETQNLFIGFYP